MSRINTQTIFAETIFKEGFSREENIFQIENVVEDSFLKYQLDSPLLFTLASCSGTGENDYVNFYSLTTEESYYFRESYPVQSEKYRKWPLHSHDFFELVIVLNGSIVQNIEGKEYMYNSGKCCFINRSLHHAENFLTEGYVLFVGISTQLLKELTTIPDSFFPNTRDMLLDTTLFDFVRSDLISPGAKSYLDYIPTRSNMHAYHFLHDICKDMITAFLSPQYGATYTLKGFLCSLISKLCDRNYYHCTKVELDLSADYLIFSRIAHLLEESDGRMSRSDLEKNLLYSGDYLNRIVKKYSNLCLYDYSMTFCMKKAATLLATTTETIESISEQLQFSNRTHFYKLFKKTYGMTPLEYRKKSDIGII